MNASQAAILKQTADFVREQLAADASGHDWWHIDRVWRNARYLAREENAHLYVVELAALLHDIGDWKFHKGDTSVGPRLVGEWLRSAGVDQPTADHVCAIVAGISFKGAGVADELETLEGRVVQDADRLDALGAIGIARTFAYGGHAGRLLYDPEIPPEAHATFAAYQKSRAPSINHFYEKLLLLKDRMKTATGRRLAEERHRFLEVFLAQFFAEWNGPEEHHVTENCD